MPRSGRSQAQNLQRADATQKALANAVDISSQNLLEEYKQQLNKATEKIAYLESELESKCLYCSQIVSSLEEVQKKAEELSSELDRVKLQAETQYKKVRVEHRAQQRAQARKDVLFRQIRLLKSAERERSEDYENSSSKAVDSLLKLEKEKSKLQSELSKCLQQSQAEFRHFQDKLLALQNKVKESKHLASNLKKQHD
jgi:chromosome segregation ATPase